MKKKTASLVTAAMLLTMAWMTGCDSGKLEQSSGESTAAPVETTAESVADAPEETTGADGSGDNIQVFASSLDFEAAMAEQYPEVLLYEPPESFTAQWNLQQILLLADEKTPFYTQQFSREDAQAGTETVEIQVYFLNSYTSAEEGFQDFFQTAGGYTLASTVDQGCCIITDTAQQRSMLCGITTDSTFLYRVDASRTDAQGTQTGFSETELTALRQELML